MRRTPRAAAAMAVALLLCAAAAHGQASDQASGGGVQAPSELRPLGLPPLSVSSGDGEAKARGSGLPTTIALGGVVGLAVVAGGVVRLVARRKGGFFASLGAGGRAPAGIMEIIGRYPVGRGARVITTSRDLLPDRIFDEVVSRTYGTR